MAIRRYYCIITELLLLLYFCHLRSGVPRDQWRDDDFHALVVIEEVVAHHEVEELPRRRAPAGVWGWRGADDAVGDRSIGIHLFVCGREKGGGGKENSYKHDSLDTNKNIFVKHEAKAASGRVCTYYARSLRPPVRYVRQPPHKKEEARVATADRGGRDVVVVSRSACRGVYIIAKEKSPI